MGNVRFSSYIDEKQSLREVKIKSLGVNYPYNLFNSALLKVLPGEQFKTANILKDLFYAELDYINVTEKCHEKNEKGDLFLPMGCIEGIREREETRERAKFDRINRDVSMSLDYNPILTTHFGTFDLSCMFQSSGFARYHLITGIDNVLSEHYILGTVPVPEDAKHQKQLKALVQDQLDFFKESEASLFESVGEPHLEHTQSSPLIAICQLQATGVISTSFAGGLILPLMMKVDEILGKICTQNKKLDIKGMLIDCFGWNDWTIILRGGSYSLLAECINEIRNITWKDIYTKLNNIYTPSDLKFKAHGFERLERIINLLSEQENNTKEADNHILSTSMTSCGILSQFKDKTETFDKWNIEDNKTSFSINITSKPGHEKAVHESIFPTAKEQYFSVGKTDISISSTDMCDNTENSLKDTLQQWFLHIEKLKDSKHITSTTKEFHSEIPFSKTGGNIYPYIDLFTKHITKYLAPHKNLCTSFGSGR
jgi:hypothetical protein